MGQYSDEELSHLIERANADKLDMTKRNDVLAYVKQKVLDRIRGRIGTREFPKDRLRGHKESGDWLGIVLEKLDRALAQGQIESVRDVFRLLGRWIDQVSVDFWRELFGPHGDGRNIVGDKGGNLPKKSDRRRDGRRRSGPDDHAIRKEKQAQVRAALANLEPEEQEVVRLIKFKGHTYKQAATELGIPVGTLKRRLADALKQLARDGKLQELMGR